MSGIILSWDLGKYKSVGCVFDPVSGEAQFATVATTPADLEKHLRSVMPSRVVFETCTIAAWVSELCSRVGVAWTVANPNGEAWRWKNVKRKTDRDDALKLARLAASKELPSVPVPPAAVRQKRSLLKFRQSVVSHRVALQNHLRALVEAQGLRLAPGAKAWTKLGVTLMETWAKPLGECGLEELWKGELRVCLDDWLAARTREAELDAKLEALAASDPGVIRLQTIPGVGRATAEVVANYLNDPKRFKTAGEVSCYAGMVPTQYQSGQCDRKGRITKRGPGLLRKALVECGWCLLRYNAWGQGVFEKISKGQKTRRKVAAVALGRKLLVVCWAMLKRGEDWKEPAAPAPSSSAAA